MLTDVKHYGGGMYEISSPDLQIDSPRVIRYFNGSPSTIFLYDPYIYGSSQPPIQLGRPRFFVLNTHGTSTVTFKSPISAATICTLAPGKWAALSTRLDGHTDGWVCVMTGTIGASMNTTSPGHSIVDPTTSLSYTPYCFFGTPCEFIGTTVTPLDGLLGRNKVIAPFFQDIATHAKNSSREAVRAADWIMPNQIPLSFKDGDFTKDVLHPLSGTTLSTYFYDALYNRATVSQNGPGAEPHVVTYDNSLASNSKTSDWCHAAYVKGTPDFWNHGPVAADLLARKYVWRKLIPYGPPSAPTSFTLEIRLTMEHTLSADVQSHGISNNTSPYDGGLWGALFTVAVFTDELSTGWNDASSTFTPYGWSNAFNFKRIDPARHALAYGIKATETVNTVKKRGVHPQCVILAHVPTTFHNPLGRNYVPVFNRDYFDPSDATRRGRNFERAYDVPNGSPWLPGTCATTYPNQNTGGTWPTFEYGIYQNIVFGWPFSAGSPVPCGQAMTCGGGMDMSRPMDWLCFENPAAGNGLTYLKAAKPGWDTTCGTFNIANGSSGAIAFCSTEYIEPADPGKVPVPWPELPARCCYGHVDEPYEGLGGSHTCFLNRARLGDPQLTGQQCCVPIVPTSGRVIERAYDHVIHYTSQYSTVYCVGYSRTDPYLNVWEENVLFGTWVTEFRLYISDYSLAPDINAATRYIQWVALIPPASTPLRIWTYNKLDTDLITGRGSFTLNTLDFLVASTTAGKIVRAHLYYNFKQVTDPGNEYQWFGAAITSTFNTVTTASHGLGLLDLTQNGYGMLVSKSGSDLLFEIVRYYDNGGGAGTARLVLATRTITGQGSNAVGLAAFTIRGCQITASYTPSGQAVNVLTAEDAHEFYIQPYPVYNDAQDASMSDLLPSAYTESATTGSKFTPSPPFITDLIPNYKHMFATLTSQQAITGYYPELYTGYGLAGNGITNHTWGSKPGCGNLACSSPLPPAPYCDYHTEIKYLTDVANSPTTTGIILNIADDGRTDLPCVAGTPWTDGSGSGTTFPVQVTYAGGPNPYRCVCAVQDCSGSGRTCPDVPPDRQLLGSFYIPSNKECWDIDGAFFANDLTPWVCKGIDVYSQVGGVCG